MSVDEKTPVGPGDNVLLSSNWRGHGSQLHAAPNAWPGDVELRKADAIPIAVKKSTLASLTSLRFFAALAIVVFHLKSTMQAFFQPVRGVYLLDRLACGVGFFFILSGFVLYYNYGERRKLDLKDFYVKRWTRIYPLHLLTFTIWCAVFYSTWGATTNEKLLSGLANLTLTQSLFPGFLFCLGFNAVSWSLSNEALFYAVFPWLRRTIACVTVMGAIAAYLVVSHAVGFTEATNRVFPNNEYFFAPLRLVEFCAGIFIAKVFSENAKLPHATLLEALALAVVLFNVCFQSVHFSLEQLSHLPAFAAMIWVFAHQQGAFSRVLANQKVLIFLGEASFSLYMWHHMIMSWCNRHIPTTTPAWLSVSIAVGASLLVSTVSFRWFEDPVRKLLTKAILCRHPLTLAAQQPDDSCSESSVRAAA